MSTDWHELRESSLATMTPAERAEYAAAAVEADIALDIAQLVYDARIKAGLSKAELASRIGASQATICQVEGGGGELPTRTILARIARATGQAVQFDIPLLSGNRGSPPINPVTVPDVACKSRFIGPSSFSGTSVT